MRKLALLLFFVLAFGVNVRADGLRSHTFTTATSDTKIKLSGTGIAYNKITWNKTGTVSVCTVTLDSSVDGITWTAGGVVTSQNCATNGASTTINSVVNYVRMTVATFTGTGNVQVTWNGYVNLPSGGGTVTGIFTAPRVPFASASTTLVDDANFTYTSASDLLALSGTVTVLNAGPIDSLDHAEGAYQNLTGLGPVQIGGLNVGTEAAAALSVASQQTAASNNMSATFTTMAVGGSVARSGLAMSHYAQQFVYGSTHPNTVGGYYAEGAVVKNTAVVDYYTGFYADPAILINSGVVHNNFGYYANNMNGVGDTLNAAFYSVDQGNGTNDYSYYSAGGKNYFAGQIATSSLLASGIVDGTAPVTVTSSTPITVGSTYKSGYYFNEHATEATAITYNLPTAAAGLQYCFYNAYETAAETGVLTVATSAAGQFIIFTDGTLSATGGNVTSGGAARDAACFVGVDATHWMLVVGSGTWAKH